MQQESRMLQSKLKVSSTSKNQMLFHTWQRVGVFFLFSMSGEEDGDLWEKLSVYRDEVPSPAVDVNIVIIHTDHFVGLCHEESGTAELRTLGCEGELTLHCNHVQTTWQTVTQECIRIDVLKPTENSMYKMYFDFV